MAPLFWQLIVVFIILGVAGWPLLKRWRRTASQERETLQPAGNALRYALASAVLDGRFRRETIKEANNHYRAVAPELGLDGPVVIAACRHFEEASLRFRWIILGLVMAIPLSAMFSAGSGFFALVFAGSILALTGFGIHKLYVDRFRRIAPFRRENWDSKAIREKYARADIPSFTREDNVLVFGTRQPFVGFGYWTGGWQAGIDLKRRRDKHTELSDICAETIYDRTAKAICALELPGLECSAIAFVSGTEVSGIDTLMRDPFVRPARQVDEDTMHGFLTQADPRVRGYRLFRITDWGGEVVISYLFRTMRRGDVLTLEVAKLFLPPVDEKYRRIDALRKPSAMDLFLWWLTVPVRLPLVWLSALAGATIQIGREIGAIIRDTNSRERQEIRFNPAYNYGARTTIRERLAGRDYHVYFQAVDAEQYLNVLDVTVLNTVADQLEQAGVNASQLREQAQMIVNNGTLIQSGGGGITIKDSSLTGKFGRASSGRSEKRKTDGPKAA